MNAKQILKNTLYKYLLPFAYRLYSRRPVEEKKILLADCNHRELPESMQVVEEELKRRGYKVCHRFTDFRDGGVIRMTLWMFHFMKEYATCRGLFVCNYFLPMNACEKRPETKVCQLWHSCGLYKKFGYDTKYDISPEYKGSVTRNIDLYTVSSPLCREVMADALRLQGEERRIMQAVGVSRTDWLFSPEAQENLRQRFFKNHPEARGKKILLWAPTFRNTASSPEIVGEEAIDALASTLGEEWLVVKKCHPMARKADDWSDFTAMQLFAVTDILISDFSTIIFEFALFHRPILLFAPDFDQYLEDRGTYTSPETDFPFPVVRRGENLPKAVEREISRFADATPEDKNQWNAFLERYMGACDGHSTERILDTLGLFHLPGEDDGQK